jgi:hypothetical protein
MHITADDPRFMSEFDAQKYVEMLLRSQSQSVVLYTHSHVGLCNFPTKVGQMHPGLKGRDILREMIDECHKHGIGVAAYYSVIYDTWAYRTHPDWRIIGADGQPVAERSRYGVCCVNSPYRDHVASIVEELCWNYEFEGIRFDMTFWPRVCYCHHCQECFARETGRDLPKVINWEDPHWVSFQRKREEWLVDFAALQTATVRRFKPGASIEHQASTYHAGWRLGVTQRLARENTFLQGDFYGDSLQGSVARKMFYNLTENRPGAFETSIGVDLRNYTALKSKELLTCKAYAALADASAFLFIDSIDPVGTLNPTVYDKMGHIFEQTKVYEPHVGGELCQDVGIYLSTESKCDFADNGKPVDGAGLSSSMPHVEAVQGAAKALIEHHLPFGVITKKSLKNLAQHKIVVLPDVLMMDQEEADAFREYVRAGGSLYASRYTSLITKDGRRQPDFLLADVFGASYKGETQENFTYIAPAEAGRDRALASLFGEYTVRHPLGLKTQQMKIEAAPGAQVLGRLVLPYTDPSDPMRYASIHNNPPGVYTGRPAMVMNRFGKGAAIYVGGAIENNDPSRDVFVALLRLLAPSFSFEADAPKAVEMTVFHQADRGRIIINLLNFQKDLPNIPVEGIRARVRLASPERGAAPFGKGEGSRPGVRRLIGLPGETPVSYEVKDGYVHFVAPRFETFQMLALEYR